MDYLCSIYILNGEERILVLINERLRDVDKKQRKTNINRQIDSETFGNN